MSPMTATSTSESATAAADVDIDLTDPPRERTTVSSNWLDGVFVIGLAGVFIVNAVAALVRPDDFTELVARSSIGQWLRLGDVAWVAPAIAVNDFLLGLAVLAAARLGRLRMLVLAWAGTWLLAVTLIKLTAFGAS